MTQYYQLTRETAGWLDVTVFNNAVTDIPAGYCVLAETVSGQARAVALPTNGGGFARLFGVTTSIIPAGGYGTCCIHGPALAVAHEALATGAIVQAYDATSHLGEVQAHLVGTTQEGVPVLGTVMNASGTDGDWCQVFVNINPTTTTQ